MTYTDDERRAFGSTIRAAREKAGLTVAELAALVSTPTRTVSQQSISTWEAGSVPARPSQIFPLLEQHLGLPDGALYSALGNPPEASEVIDDVEALKAAVTSLEARVTTLEAARILDSPSPSRLRAADSDTPDDPGPVRGATPTRKRATRLRPDGP